MSFDIRSPLSQGWLKVESRLLLLAAHALGFGIVECAETGFGWNVIACHVYREATRFQIITRNIFFNFHVTQTNRTTQSMAIITRGQVADDDAIAQNGHNASSEYSISILQLAKNAVAQSR